MSRGFLAFLYSQLFVSLPVPNTSFAGKTIIVTGSNVGLGKEATRHFARLGASSIIMAVRSLEKGARAKTDIESSTGCGKDVIKVWQLDMSSYQSVQDFGAKVDRELPRLDIAILNAGIATMKWDMAEQDESTITVNVVSTFLLAHLLLPKLKESAQKFNIRPNLTITASEVHAWCRFEERNTPNGNIFKNMSDKKWSSDMDERYHVSKLLEVLCVRTMADRKSASQIPVTINCVNPGFCFSELTRELGLGVKIFQKFVGRSTEAGSRTLVHAASQGPESHGAYMSDCGVAQPSTFVLSKDGYESQERVWKELETKLEGIKEGVTGNL